MTKNTEHAIIKCKKYQMPKKSMKTLKTSVLLTKEDQQRLKYIRSQGYSLAQITRAAIRKRFIELKQTNSLAAEKNQ